MRQKNILEKIHRLNLFSLHLEYDVSPTKTRARRRSTSPHLRHQQTDRPAIPEKARQRRRELLENETQLFGVRMLALHPETVFHNDVLHVYRRFHPQGQRDGVRGAAVDGKTPASRFHIDKGEIRASLDLRDDHPENFRLEGFQNVAHQVVRHRPVRHGLLEFHVNRPRLRRANPDGQQLTFPFLF